jgi:uncharacterized repeat protein (TIGR01451 family)
MMRRQILAAFLVFVLGSTAVLALPLFGPDDVLPVSRADAFEQTSIGASVNGFKIVSAENVRPGDVITYTIIAYNNDPTEEVDILMVDQIPAHTVYVTHTIASRIPISGTVQLPGTGILPLTDAIFLRTTLGKRGTVFPAWVTLGTLTVRVEEDAPMGRIIVNRAQFWYGDEPEYFVREAATTVMYVLYLPITMREADAGRR